VLFTMARKLSPDKFVKAVSLEEGSIHRAILTSQVWRSFMAESGLEPRYVLLTHDIRKI